MQTRASFKRRVKIVCTLGPSSQSDAILEGLIREGMDVARLNFSHGTHEFHKGLIEKVRRIAKKQKRSVAILQDLQGPKIRVGDVSKEGLVLTSGKSAVLVPQSHAKMSSKGVPVIPIPEDLFSVFVKDLKKGSRVLFDDGKIISVVSEKKKNILEIHLENGGTLFSHKGINLPGAPLSLSCLTDKDLKDLEFGVSQEVDAVALSFVRETSDVVSLQKKIASYGNHRPLVIAKIEREEALDHLDGIIDVSDGLLVARGDMAVEVGVERVPVAQKEMIWACNELGVPIITATQMLESMISSPTPTRAEASDVANAVFDGTDAVMLSGETASGKYPIETVRTMAKIVMGAEHAVDRYSKHRGAEPMPGSIVDSIEFSASRVAHHVGAVAIACITHSGKAARTLAKYRPGTPIVAIMDREELLRQMAFVWGVQGELIPKIVETDDLFMTVEKLLKEKGWAREGDLIVVTAGIPSLRRGTTNMIKVHRVGSSIERAKSRI